MIRRWMLDLQTVLIEELDLETELIEGGMWVNGVHEATLRMRVNKLINVDVGNDGGPELLDVQAFPVYYVYAPGPYVPRRLSKQAEAVAEIKRILSDGEIGACWMQFADEHADVL